MSGHRRGVLFGTDHHRANFKMTRSIEANLPETVLSLHGLCKQHATAMCLQPLSALLGLLCPLYCCAKIMLNGDFYDSWQMSVRTVIQNNISVIKASERPDWAPDEDDKRQSEALLEFMYYERDLSRQFLTFEERAKLE